MDIYNLTLDELTTALAEMGQPAYRARQVYEWVYRHGARSFEAMSNLPRALRAALGERFTFDAVRPASAAADEEAERVLLDLAAGGHVEMARFRSAPGWTACLSTQVGCAVGCEFCASGARGLERNLSAGEIVGQLFAVVGGQECPPHAGDPERVKSIVFMGIGEPFHNYDALLNAIRILSDPCGFAFSSGRMTVSTSGVVPMIERFGQERLRTHLAISLNTTDDQLRRELMPGIGPWTVEEVIAAGERYVRLSGRRVTYAHALLAGVNDSPADAARLAGLLQGRLCHVNVIPYNPTEAGSFRSPSAQRVQEFVRTLRNARIATTLRFTRGRSVQAACGQLRLERQ